MLWTGSSASFRIEPGHRPFTVQHPPLQLGTAHQIPEMRKKWEPLFRRLLRTILVDLSPAAWKPVGTLAGTLVTVLVS